MWVEELSLKDYRNYKSQKIVFSEAINFVIGNNGEGKTNLLESLYLLATTKSHRLVADKDLVRTCADYFYLSCRIRDNRQHNTIELGYSLSQKRKVAKLSGVPVTRVSELIGVLNVVLFSPEDLDLVKGSPGGRRRFLDVLLSQIDRIYLGLLQQYARVLEQRNECLKGIQQGKFKVHDLEPWTEQFVTLGVKITTRRRKAIIDLQPIFAKLAAGVNQSKESLTLEYMPSFAETTVHEHVMRLQAQEVRRGITLSGPHRDDIKFLINSFPAADYASQGQQRTAALALKLAELEYMYQVKGDYPVLLLDDVLSELDVQRRTALIDALHSNVQSIITGTDIALLSPVSPHRGHKIIKVEQGKVV